MKKINNEKSNDDEFIFASLLNKDPEFSKIVKKLNRVTTLKIIGLIILMGFLIVLATIMIGAAYNLLVEYYIPMWPDGKILFSLILAYIAISILLMIVVYKTEKKIFEVEDNYNISVQKLCREKLESKEI